MNYLELVKFITEIDKLKHIHRQTLTFHGKRDENSAEHSWHLAMAVLVFPRIANEENLDVLKAVKLALIHDLVEIDAGDTFVYHDQFDSDKEKNEKLAAERLFGLLPKELSEEFHLLWQEFELRESNEAKYVAAIDRFLPIMANSLNGGHSWKKHNVSFDQVVKKNKQKILDGSKTLWDEVEKCLNECVSNKLLNKH